MQLTVKWAGLILALLPSLGAAGLSGRVVDHLGAAVPTARVLAAHQSSGATMERWTDADGRYKFEGLRGGGWEIHVTKDGFEPGTRQLASDDVTQVDFRLQVAILAERIVVTSAITGVAEQASEIPGSVDVLGPAVLTQARVFNPRARCRPVAGSRGGQPPPPR
jgi:hypothetical protein